jgi:hypothetical protein
MDWIVVGGFEGKLGMGMVMDGKGWGYWMSSWV